MSICNYIYVNIKGTLVPVYLEAFYATSYKVEERHVFICTNETMAGAVCIDYTAKSM